MIKMRKRISILAFLLVSVVITGCHQSPDLPVVNEEKEERPIETATDNTGKDTAKSPENTKETEEGEKSTETTQETVVASGEKTEDREYQPFTQEELDDMQYVNDAIVKLVRSDDFENATASERIAMAYDLLYDLQEGGYVTDISYDSDAMLSFEYKCGISGGISTKTAEDYWIRDADGNIIDAIN